MSSSGDPRTRGQSAGFLEALVGILGAHAESPAAEAAVLLCHALGVDRASLIAYPEREIPAAVQERVWAQAQRRARGEPIAYLVGEKEFFGRTFLVDPRVLIPRPETEELVELALTSGIPHASRVLDLACGSGCIGLTLALERPDLQVTLSDVSPGAIQATIENCARLFAGQDSRAWPIAIESDWFSNVPRCAYARIICNPPYIHPDESDTLAVDVRAFEPQLALFHPDPAGLYEFILEEARAFLADDGELLFETAPAWIDRITTGAAARDFHVSALPDLTGRPRFLRAVPAH